jgi:hypothetical protein
MQRRIARIFAWALVLIATPGRVSAALVVPAYNSSSFGAKVYLDFDGDTTASYGPYTPGTTPAYDIDGDPTSFSQQELDNIKLIWMGVSEKYSPVRINVTTVDPNTQFNATKVVIGGDGAWAPSPPGGGRPGGIGIEGSWANTGINFPNLAFVFPANLANGFARYVVEAAAHEAGHGFGLDHQSLYVNGGFVAEYNPGDANRAPIMGKSYFATRGQWWLGPTPNVPSQDDLKIITSTGPLANNFNYRNDDHPSNATDPLAAGDALLQNPDLSISGKGIIERSGDADFFSFVTGGGPAVLHADVAPFAAMLDLSLGLYDEGGTLLMSSATSSLGETNAADLAAGTYRLDISSAGGYGDIGQYFVSGFVPEPSTLSALSLLAFGLLRRNSRSIL